MACLVSLRRKIQKERLQYLAVDVWGEVTSQFEDAGKNESYDETGDDTKLVSINHFSDRFYIRLICQLRSFSSRSLGYVTLADIMKWSAGYHDTPETPVNYIQYKI